jgi:hypothetical protein
MSLHDAVADDLCSDLVSKIPGHLIIQSVFFNFRCDIRDTLDQVIT